MSTHSICYRGEIKKNINTFGLKTKKSILSRDMYFTISNDITCINGQ